MCPGRGPPPKSANTSGLQFEINFSGKFQEMSNAGEIVWETWSAPRGGRLWPGQIFPIKEFWELVCGSWHRKTRNQRNTHKGNVNEIHLFPVGGGSFPIYGGARAAPGCQVDRNMTIIILSIPPGLGFRRTRRSGRSAGSWRLPGANTERIPSGLILKQFILIIFAGGERNFRAN